MLDIMSPRKRQHRLSEGEKREQVLVRVPASLLEALDRVAAQRNVSRNALLIELLERGLNYEETAK